MMHGPEDRRDCDIAVDRVNENTYYDRDRRSPDPDYVHPGIEVAIDVVGTLRRRVLIQRLSELQEGADGDLDIHFDELADEVGAIEDDVDVEIVSNRTTRSVKVSLRRSHLPLLEDLDAVSWDPETRTVRVRDRIHDLADLLEAIADVVDETEVTDQW